MVVRKGLLTKLQAGFVRGRQECQLFSTCSSAHVEEFPPRELKGKSPLTLLREPNQEFPPRELKGKSPLTLLREPNQELVRELTQSPQLSVKSLPLLSSCLPPSPLRKEDFTWIKDNLSSIKESLHYFPSMMSVSTSADKENPLFYLDSLLYLAFQHMGAHRSLEAKFVKAGHTRLSFLGQFVTELALGEYFLLRYPRDVTACIRERIFCLTRRRVLPHWIESAGLHGIVFGVNHAKEVDNRSKIKVCRDVFWAILGASYLCMGMQEVYRVLFEVFGLDPDAENCQPSPRLRYEDVDKVYSEFANEPLHWKDVTAYKASGGSLFMKPMLFRACVPPGMSRFRGNMWEINSLPTVLQILGYPLQFEDEDAAVSISRNIELELGLQLCFCDHLAYKLEHPRFCNERLEYLGQKIQDLVMAERLVTRHLDAPGAWLHDRHRRLLFNRVCGKYLREFKLQNHIIYRDPCEEQIFRGRNSEKIASTSVSQALHGLGYVAYGKAEVARLMNTVFKFERSKAKRR